MALSGSRYLAFCATDSLYFEPPSKIADGATRWILPTTVSGRLTSKEDDVWVRVDYPGKRIPDQGWKMHISSTPDQAQQTLEIVASICARLELNYKFLRSRTQLDLQNSKHAPRGSSGKFVTIYPSEKDDLENLLAQFSDALRGFRGPYILSDIRWNDESPVFLRYGGFAPKMTADEKGNRTPAISKPDGTLVADRREPRFTIPEWVEVPEFLKKRIREFSTLSRIDLPFKIDRVISHSNGGGVYLAEGPATGWGPIVLKEARPHAGLDAAGRDAVTRLRHEFEMLRHLQDTGRVPRIYEYRKFWEHEFLIQEYLEGEVLALAMRNRYPGLASVGLDRAEYVDWALRVSEEIDSAVSDVHAAGFVFGDLHPSNIIIQSDGKVKFVDLEAVHRIGNERTGLLGAPGYAAPPKFSGTAIDVFSVNAMKLYQFAPVPSLSLLDSSQPVKLARWAHDNFPLPEAYAHRAAANLSNVTPNLKIGSDRLPVVDLMESLSIAITASATPHRRDRLFPASPGFTQPGGTVNLMNGAAGVMAAMNKAGFQVPKEWREWLIDTTRRTGEDVPAGLWDGLHGVAGTLYSLGDRESALDFLSRAQERFSDLQSPGISSGISGAGLSLLRFYGWTGDQSYLEDARMIADSLITAIQSSGAVALSSGLLRGRSGVALFLVRLYRETNDSGYLDFACHMLLDELDQWEEREKSAGKTKVTTPYLYAGASGIGSVLIEYLQHDVHERMSVALDNFRQRARIWFTELPGLLHGRAGLMWFLAKSGKPEDISMIQEHADQLAIHAISHAGGIAFPGDHLMRLSMDLSTGSAGVLLALSAFRQKSS